MSFSLTQLWTQISSQTGKFGHNEARQFKFAKSAEESVDTKPITSSCESIVAIHKLYMVEGS